MSQPAVRTECRVPVQDQQQPERLEADEEQRLGHGEAEAQSGKPLRGRGSRATEYVRAEGIPRFPSWVITSGQRIKAARYPRPLGPQHPGEQRAGHDEDRLDREARCHRERRVPLQPPCGCARDRLGRAGGDVRLSSSVADTRLTLRGVFGPGFTRLPPGRPIACQKLRRLNPEQLSEVQSKLPRLRHQRHVRMLPVVYRHRGVSRRDAFLVSYPKSGNTWLKFMLAHLLGGREADLDNDSTVIADVGSHRATPRVLPEAGA